MVSLKPLPSNHLLFLALLLPAGPIHLPGEVPKMNDKVVLFSIVLWVGALFAIVILMFSLWRSSKATGKQATPVTPEPSPEEKPVPAPEPQEKPTPDEVNAAFQQGVDLVHVGRAAEGIFELRKVIDAQPGNKAAWFWLGIASTRLKDDRSAERCFLQAKKHGHPEADQALDWLKKQKS